MKDLENEKKNVEALIKGIPKRPTELIEVGPWKEEEVKIIMVSEYFSGASLQELVDWVVCEAEMTGEDITIDLSDVYVDADEDSNSDQVYVYTNRPEGKGERESRKKAYDIQVARKKERDLEIEKWDTLWEEALLLLEERLLAIRKKIIRGREGVGSITTEECITKLRPSTEE